MTRIEALETIEFLAIDNPKSDTGYTPERRLELIGAIAQELLKGEYKRLAAEGPNHATLYGMS